MNYRTAATTCALLAPLLSFGAEKKMAEWTSVLSNPVFLALLLIIVVLALVIYGMAQMVKAGASVNVDRAKREKQKEPNGPKITVLFAFLLAGNFLFAQDAVAPGSIETSNAVAEVPFDFWGLGGMMFLSMVLFIGMEAMIICVLYFTGIRLLRTEEQERKQEELRKARAVRKIRWFRSITDRQTAEEEEALLSDHEYDGIRELDNNLPLWWKYGFYLTIVIAVVYLSAYHVFNGPSSAEEYQAEVAAGEAQVAEYKKNAAGLVDENSVVALTDAGALAAGKGIFMTNCAACHGAKGEGIVGPNLTDEYWLHKGGVADVFRSVKYGWPDKGMKSWEQDLKPVEMQQVVSYILSLKGTNPPNSKAKEGDLYVDTVSKAPAQDTMQADSAVKN